MRLPARIIRFTVHLYMKLVSPLLPPRCRFYPTCSQYAHEALRSHGLAAGGLLTLRRLARCHPFARGPWHDPVPAARAAQEPID